MEGLADNSMVVPAHSLIASFHKDVLHPLIQNIFVERNECILLSKDD
jgi:hypothetical protein